MSALDDHEVSVTRETTVGIANAGTVKITCEGNTLAEDLLVAAAKQLGLDTAVVSKLQVVVNGEDAKLGDQVPAGAVVTGAPGVNNG